MLSLPAALLAMAVTGGAGDTVLAVETEAGILLTPYDPDTAEALAIAAEVARLEERWLALQTEIEALTADGEA